MTTAGYASTPPTDADREEWLNVALDGLVRSDVLILPPVLHSQPTFMLAEGQGWEALTPLLDGLR